MAPALATARIGDGAEELWQGLHLSGAEHELRYSSSQRCGQIGLGQNGADLRAKRAQQDGLGRVGRGAIAALAAPVAEGGADLDPVRGAIERTAVAARIDEGLEQENRVPERLEPIGTEPSLAQGEDARSNVRTMPGGQNAISGVVHQQVQPRVLLPIAPADPAVPRGNLQCGGGKAQQRYLLLTPTRHVPQRLANLRQRPEVVVRLHQLLETPPLLGQYPPHLDISEHSHSAHCSPLPVPLIRHRGGEVQSGERGLDRSGAWPQG